MQSYTFSRTALPQQWVLDNYQYVFRNIGFGRYLFNSILATGIGMVIYLYICNAAGFALGLLRFRLKLIFLSFILFFRYFPRW